MPFNIGDKVVVKQGEEGAFFHRDEEVEVLDVSRDGDQIKVSIWVGEEQWVRAARFNLAIVPLVPERLFQVGDLVRIADVEKNRNEPIAPRVHIGQEFRVLDVANRDGFDGNGNQNIRIERGGGRWNSIRFELVAAVDQAQLADVPAPVAAWVNPFQDRFMDDNAIIKPEPKFKVGDKVKLIGQNGVKGPGWVPRVMDDMVGNEYVISQLVDSWDRMGGKYYLLKDTPENFKYDAAWLELVDQWVMGAKVYFQAHVDIYNGNLALCPEYFIVSIEEDGRVKVLSKDKMEFGPYKKNQWVLAKDQEKVVPKKKEEHKIDPLEQQKKIDKMLKTCREKLIEGSGGCANFYVIRQDKKGSLSKIGGTYQTCHYELRGGYGEEAKGLPVAVIDSISGREEELSGHYEQGFKDYVNYLLNRSPWAIAYKTKTFEEAVSNCIDMNIDVTANILAGACIAMRQSSEYRDVLPVHAFLKSKRFSGDVCFLVGQHFTMDAKGVFSPLNINSGHSILTTTMPADALFKFFATKQFVGEADKKPYKEYMVYNNIFGSITGKEEYARAKAGEVSIQQWMHNNCPIDTVGQGFGKKQTVTEANILKLARAVKNELAKYKQVEVS